MGRQFPDEGRAAHGDVTAEAAGDMGRGFSGLAASRRLEPWSDAVLVGFHALVPQLHALVRQLHTLKQVLHALKQVSHALKRVLHALKQVLHALERVRSCKHRKPPQHGNKEDGRPISRPGSEHGEHGRVR